MGSCGVYVSEEDREFSAFRKMHSAPCSGDIVLMETPESDHIPVLVTADKSDPRGRCRKLNKLFCADVQGHFEGQWVPISRIKIFKPQPAKMQGRRSGSLKFFHKKTLFSQALKIYYSSGQHKRTAEVEEAVAEEKEPLPIFLPVHELPDPTVCPSLSELISDGKKSGTEGIMNLKKLNQRVHAMDSEENLGQSSTGPGVFYGCNSSDPRPLPYPYDQIDGKKNLKGKKEALKRLNLLPQGVFGQIVELRQKIKSIREADTGRNLEMNLAKSISVDEVAPVMSVSRDDLCILLDIGVTSWKSFVHHGLGIHRWPGRRMKPVDTNIRVLQDKIEAAESENKKEEVEVLTQELKAAEEQRAAKIWSIVGAANCGQMETVEKARV